jgi:sugar/nucleoside kinase (ribokinase family)
MGDAFDVAVVGAPFLDLTFEGLERVPAAGEELVARALHATPGGTAIQAIGAARLALSAALIAPRPTGALAPLLISLIEDEGVRWIGGEGHATSVTAILPSGGEHPAMASVVGPSEPTAADVTSVDAGTVLASIGRIALVPDGRAIHATTGSLEGARSTEELGAALRRSRSLVVNEREAETLTGATGVDALSRLRAFGAASCVITLGRRGAIAADELGTCETAAPEVDAIDATGAGDVFAATYVWADLRGLALAERIAWAALAAAMSVRAPTAVDGAPHLEELLAEGRRRGLEAP